STSSLCATPRSYTLSLHDALPILSAGPAFAETPRMDRAIKKEPVYQTRTPKYGLLVFGPEGKDRVWLVRDGDTLYVDRNGNGDLDRKSTRLNSSHRTISYAVFCLK